MIETLEGLEAGSIKPIRQDEAAASVAPILQREDALVDFNRTANEIYNRWRGFQPWPGAYTFFRGRKLSLHRLVPAVPMAAQSHPGELAVDRDRLFVAAGANTWLELLEIQLEGKKRMPVGDFLRGTAPHKHELLGVMLPSSS
jgi:methionyl-tRNA formyltransferase